MQPVPITTKGVSLNPVCGEIYLIQHYVIKFVSDLRQVSGFLRVLRFPPQKWPQRCNWNIFKRGVKQNKPTQNQVVCLNDKVCSFLIFVTDRPYLSVVIDMLQCPTSTAYNVYRQRPHSSFYPFILVKHKAVYNYDLVSYLFFHVCHFHVHISKLFYLIKIWSKIL